MSRNSSSLGVLAAIGSVLALSIVAVQSFPEAPRQAGSAIVAVFVGLACLVLVKLVFAEELRSVLGNRELLVPFGILLGIESLLGLITEAGLLGGSGFVRPLGITMPFSIAVLLRMLLYTAYASWITHLVVAVGCGEPADSAGTLRPAMGSFWRVFFSLFLGVFLFLMMMALVISLGAAGGMAIALLLIVAGGLLLNLATMALLPVIVISTLPMLEAIVEGIRTSWSRKSSWLGLILLQWALLGGVTYFSVSFINDEGTHVSNSSFGVNGKWLGGYETDTDWYGKYCEAVEITEVPLIALGLQLVFMLLAIVIKLRVVSRLGDYAASNEGT